VPEIYNNSPIVEEGQYLAPRGKRLREYVNKLSTDARQDDSDRQTWLRKQQYFERRRLGLEYRNPDFPWPGSSDIVMPLIDMMSDKIKPAFTNLVFGNQRTVSLIPQTPESIPTARKAEKFLNWFIQYRCENLYEQIDLGVDRLVNNGHTVFNVFWEHRTKDRHITINRRSMPDRYKRFTVTAASKQDADAIAALTNGERVPMTVEEFDANVGAVRRLISMDYGLSFTDPVEKVSIDKIVSFLRNPKEAGQRIVIKKREVEYSWPKVVSVDPSDLFVPKGTTEIQMAPRVTERMWYFEEDLVRRVRDNDWDQRAAEKILNSKGPSGHNIGMSEIYQSASEPLDIINFRENMYEVWRTYSWWDIDGDGNDELCEFYYSPNSKDTVLSASEVAMIPYVKIDFEHRSQDYYSSRGIGEKLDDLDVEVTAQHRAKLNRMMIANSPTFMYRAGSDLQPNQLQWIPGQFLPILEQGDISPLQVPNLDMSFDKEEQILRTWAEQYIGGTDFGLTSDSSLTESRTAQEIRAIEANREQVLSTRARSFQKGMSRIWNIVWDLLMTYQKEEAYVIVTGSRMLKLSPSEIMGDYNIVPVGSVGIFDPVFRAQKAMVRLRTIMEAAQFVEGDPKFEISIGEALAAYLEEDDAIQAEAIIRRRSPEEVQAIVEEQNRREQIRQQVEDNVPTDINELKEVTDNMIKRAPHGRAQRIK